MTFQWLYRDVLKIHNNLFNQLKIGVCLGRLRSTLGQSMFQNVSLCKTERIWAVINLKI